MFDRIGKFSATFRYPIIAAWVGLVIIVLIFAPSLSDTVTADPSGYLPEDEASVVAAEIAAEYFPDQASPAQAVLVIQSDDGSMRSEANQAYLIELTDWLENSLPQEAVGTILSPADPELESRLISKDEQVAMIFVGLRGSVEDNAVVDTLGEMEAYLEGAPEGLIGYVTGSVAIASDYLQGSLESVDRTTVITIILVITILLLIYRSLVSPLVPLATIGAAFLVSRGIVAWLATLGLDVSSLTEMFLVVLLFGAGTDYCLFLVSRFREYMADDLPGPEGARRTVDRVGETITSSAGTVIVGMVAMSFAQMGLFANTGPSLALGVAVALLAGLTLTPALLALLGKWAFWPGGAHHARHGGFWTKLAHWVTGRPWVPLGLALVILVPLTIYGQGMPRNFDLLSDLPDDVASKAGFQVLSEHFGAGEMQPLDVIVIDIPDARSPEGMAGIDALTRELLLVEGVADVRSLTLPAGQSDPEVADALRVDGQLTLMLEMMGEIRAQVGDPSALAGMDVDQATSGFVLVRAYLDDLAVAFPDLAGNANYQAAVSSLGSLEKAIEAGQERMLVSNQLTEAAAGLSSGDITTSGAPSAAMLDEAAAGFSALRAYLAGLAQAQPAVTELDGYDEALAALDRLDASVAEIQEALLVSTQLDLLATIIADMAATLQDPAALAELSASPEQMGGLEVLDSYLQGLIEAHPALAQQASYPAAVEHLAAVQRAVAEMMQARLISYQLAMVAENMDESARALEENPMSLLPQPGEPSAAEQMALLAAYLQELGDAHPSLAAGEDYQIAMATLAEMGEALETLDLTKIEQLIAGTQESLATLSAAFSGLSATAAETLPEATFTPSNATEGMLSFAPDLAPLVGEMEATGAEFAALAEGVRQEMPDATFVPAADLLATTGAPGSLFALEAVGDGLAAAIDDLATSLNDLAAAAAVELPEAAYIPEGDLLAGEADAAVEALMAEVDAFEAALQGLADDFRARDDGFFVPEALAAESGQEIDQLLDTYSTAEGGAARLQVVLADDPFSTEAMDTVARLRDEVRTASTGYVSGSPATNLDLKEVMDRDYVRTMVLVIGGIFVVLILLLRSLVAPVYMMGTILLSYGATLGITRLVFGGIYGEGLAWFVPFLIFVVLVALGMDYNIFLMGRVKEESARGTKAGIERAVERTGGIITSAGIIMAGTFAAMMASSLLGLVQIAFAVAVGILLDTFVIRTTIMPAIATLLGRWNWWPGKGPQ
ncbi:MAG: MMPL family transporter [Anaerolineae bacterium]|jgi:transport protein